MPDPKKKKNTPVNASTDTGTGGPKRMYKKATPRPPASGGSGGTVGTHGQPKMYKKRIPRQVAEDAVGGTVGGVLSNRRTATPRTETIGTAKATPIARTETIGTAKATPISQSNITQPGHTNRPADPFLAGFNSDDYSVVRNRNRGGNRRQSR